jgi:hypothetical protein
MRIVLEGLAVVAMLVAALPAYAQLPDDDEGVDLVGTTTTCESKDGRRRFCPVPLGGLGAVVVHNFSRVPCVEGQNWSYRSDGIWVDDGCRAEFRIVAVEGFGPGGEGAEVVLCESRDFRRSYCPIGRAHDVRLVRQTSNSPCTQGRTWGYDGRQIWVDQGCAGEFELFR